MIALFVLVSCNLSSFQRRSGDNSQEGCSSKHRSGRCDPVNKDGDQVEDYNDDNNENTSSDSTFYLLNETGKTITISYSRGSENIKNSIRNRQCMFFHVNDLRYIDITPSKCSWNCPEDYSGCRYCPTNSGYYVMNDNAPSDVHPSMYSGFEKTGRQSGHSSCSRFN